MRKQSIILWLNVSFLGGLDFWGSYTQNISIAFYFFSSTISDRTDSGTFASDSSYSAVSPVLGVELCPVTAIPDGAMKCCLVFVCSAFLSYCEVGSDSFQALYMSEQKLEIFYKINIQSKPSHTQSIIFTKMTFKIDTKVWVKNKSTKDV